MSSNSGCVPKFRLELGFSELCSKQSALWHWFLLRKFVTAAITVRATHDDVIRWKHFPRHWPLCGEFAGHRRIPLTKASDAELWCFLWSELEQTVEVNNREAGDLIRHRSHYNVTVMRWKAIAASKSPEAPRMANFRFCSAAELPRALQSLTFIPVPRDIIMTLHEFPGISNLPQFNCLFLTASSG